ncbi:MAG TPA: MltA domain-containing protein [Kofleriaceae bacterium]|nr:MltA domain-containing protein [Kofleriaceae bacterium]
MLARALPVRVVRVVLPVLALAACRGGRAAPAPQPDAGPGAPAPSAPSVPAASVAAASADDDDNDNDHDKHDARPPAADPFVIASADDGATAGGDVAFDPDRTAPAPAATDTLYLSPAEFKDLPGWDDDRQAAALVALRRSCARLAELPPHAWIGVDRRFGRAGDWTALCKAAARVPTTDDTAARSVLEAETRPWLAASSTGAVGKMTAYHVQPVRASRTRHDQYQTPIYARPRDLVMVDLARFLPDARGRRIWGRLDPATGALVPFPTRAEIRRGALAGQGLELLWLDDPIDALFLEIQGSGKATLDDGSTAWIQFAGKNGRPYVGIARLLRARGRLPRGQGTMQGIRAELQRDLPGLAELADGNPSQVFFTLGDEGGALGSQGVVLTNQRSAAVDRAYIAASTPLWVDTRAPRPDAPGTAPWRHLVIAQDTGGGIRGPVRADLFWGDDATAVDLAGRTGGPGRYWLLLPRGVTK